jgi:hypothetical protein
MTNANQLSCKLQHPSTQQQTHFHSELMAQLMPSLRSTGQGTLTTAQAAQLRNTAIAPHEVPCAHPQSEIVEQLLNAKQTAPDKTFSWHQPCLQQLHNTQGAPIISQRLPSSTSSFCLPAA